MLQIILMILLVGFFAKISRRPGMPLGLIYSFKLVTLVMVLYIVYIVSAAEFGLQTAFITTGITGVLAIIFSITEYRKYMNKKSEAEKQIDDIGK